MTREPSGDATRTNIETNSSINSYSSGHDTDPTYADPMISLEILRDKSRKQKERGRQKLNDYDNDNDNFNFYNEFILPEDDVEISSKLGIREVVLNIFSQSEFGLVWDAFQSFVALLSCIMFVIETYIDQTGDFYIAMVVIESFFTFIFLLDYILHVCIAARILRYIVSAHGIISIISIVPIIGVFLPSQVGFLRLLRGFRAIRVLRTHAFLLQSVDSMEAVKRMVVIVVFTVLCYIFIATGAIYTLSSIDASNFHSYSFILSNYAFGQKSLAFLDAFYFVVITCTTIGYGDIFPVTGYAKAVVLVVLGFVLMLIPRELTVISSLIENSTPYDRAYVPVDGVSHIVLICAPGCSSYNIARFLSEFFHPDRGNPVACQRVVILGTPGPDSMLISVLADSRFRDVVVYVKGDPLQARGLRRASLLYAKSVVIFAGSSSYSSEILSFRSDAVGTDSDSCVMMLCKAIRSLYPNVNIIIQLLRSASLAHKLWSGWNRELCINQLKLGLMSTSTRCPGFSTLVCNLMMSISENENVEGSSHNKNDDDCDEDDPIDDAMYDFKNPWLQSVPSGSSQEYEYGVSQEIYSIQLPSCFIGMTFKDVSLDIYLQVGAVMFGLIIGSNYSADDCKKENIDPNEQTPYHSYLCPLTYTFTGKSERVYIISSNSGIQKAVNQCANMSYKLDIRQCDDHATKRFRDPSTQPASIKLCSSDSNKSGASKVSSRGSTVKSLSNSVIKADSNPRDLFGHIIIIGGIDCVHEYVVSLRFCSMQPVVLLYPQRPEKEAWRVLALYPNVFFVQGHGNKIEDLSAAGVMNAAVVVILSSSYKFSSDAFANLCANAVASNFPSTKIFVELLSESSLTFLSSSSTPYNGDFIRFPSYASGQVFISSSMDCMMAQYYYQPEVVDIILRLLFHRATCSATKLDIDPSAITNIEENDLVGLIPVPLHCVGMPFVEFYYTLLDCSGYLPLGIMRNNKEENQSYVYTSPHPKSLLYEHDFVFVLVSTGAQ